MNVKRFQGRTTKDALTQARQFFGDDAVVLSTRPCEGGVEIMALSADAVHAMADTPAAAPARRPRVDASPAAQQPAQRASAASARPTSAEPGAVVTTAETAPGVDGDVQTLAMSTLSFQDYVRERMLRRRQEALQADETASTPEPVPAQRAGGLNTAGLLDRALSRQPQEAAPAAVARPQGSATRAGAAPITAPAGLVSVAAQAAPQPAAHAASSAAARPVPATPLDLSGKPLRAARPAGDPSPELLDELRQMKGLIEERFGTIAWLDKVQRSPAQGRLMQQLLGCGYSPALVRKVVDSLPAGHAEEQVMDWAQQVLAHNLLTDAAQPALEDRGGVYALVGSTGVGKTTTTAKLAAAFALKHGAADLGLITLDAYRLGAHDQLRAYGKILNVAVHIAHDKDALEDLLALLSTKKLVLIDTVGLAQRDARTAEMLDMLAHERIQKLLVVNAAAQGETIDDVMVAYRSSQCAGVVLSKVDEAVKLGPALDAALRRRARVIGVANGQRVPEDWQRAHAERLVRRSLHGAPSAAFEMDRAEAGLMFSLRSESLRVGGGTLHA